MSQFDRALLQSRLEQGLAQMEIALPAPVQEKLLDYLALMIKWNKVHNLTAVRDPEEMVTLHLLDSLAVLPHLQAGRLLDVGSGAGLPGIPLAICRPEMQVTVLDSSQKKASFMRQAKAELGINNLQVVCGRVEQHQPELRYDVIISRAFSDLHLFLNLTAHLGMIGTQWVAMKGVYPHEELAEIDLQPNSVVPLKVAGLEAQRHLVFFKLDKETHSTKAA